MTQEVEIPYFANGSQYVVTITAKDFGFFARAAEDESILPLRGEELVAALMKRDKGGEIELIVRTKDGERNDSPFGDPAVVSFFRNGGGIYVVKRYQDGRLNDTPKHPAWEEFKPSGRLAQFRHYSNNKLNDPAEGQPAMVDFDEDGKPGYLGFYTNGQLTGQKNWKQMEAEREAALEAALKADRTEKITKAFGPGLKLVP